MSLTKPFCRHYRIMPTTIKTHIPHIESISSKVPGWLPSSLCRSTARRDGAQSCSLSRHRQHDHLGEVSLAIIKSHNWTSLIPLARDPKQSRFHQRRTHEGGSTRSFRNCVCCPSSPWPYGHPETRVHVLIEIKINDLHTKGSDHTSHQSAFMEE